MLKQCLAPAFILRAVYVLVSVTVMSTPARGIISVIPSGPQIVRTPPGPCTFTAISPGPHVVGVTPSGPHVVGVTPSGPHIISATPARPIHCQHVSVRPQCCQDNDASPAHHQHDGASPTNHQSDTAGPARHPNCPIDLSTPFIKVSDKPMSATDLPENGLPDSADVSHGISDADAFRILWEMKMKKRQRHPSLPETVTQLTTEEGSKVYIVGTAHFSDSSKQDVVKTIQEVQPDVVVVELCQYRVSMLKMDEETLLKEAKEINFEKLHQAIKQNGVMSGLMQMLLLKVSAHITQQLGMAPGGEFREAFKEASKVPFCKFHLGDRPIPVTFKRAIAALSFWQKLKLAWGLCSLSDPISEDDVEKCKQKDLLEQMMAEMIGEFPDLHRTIVSERDLYLTYMLKQAARRIELPSASETEPRQSIPSIVVGVVGMGHVPGIERNWVNDISIQEIMSVPPPSTLSKIVTFAVKVTFFGLAGYGCYCISKRTVRMILSMPTTQYCLQRLNQMSSV